MTRVSESPERTGNPEVDAALDAVVALEDRPVAEHLAAYESAHALLRQALADTPGEPDAADPQATVDDPTSDPAGDPAGDPVADSQPGEPAG